MATVTGTTGDDVLFGDTANDRVEGLGGNDLLDGGAGSDVLVGGLGNDTYVVDSPGDRIVELEEEGIDTVYTDVNFWLAADDYVELLSARDWRSTIPLQLFGNGLVNVIDGNDGANFIDGGIGGDTMIGFAGDDVYVADSAFDRAVEDVGGGFDTIYTEVNYRLTDGDNIELLSARDWRSVTPLSLIGNSVANTIDGNDGANFLDGKAGADVLVGMGGDDVFVVDNGGDQVVEGPDGGNDLVYTTIDYALAEGTRVEVLSARDVSSTAPLVLTGNSYVNQIQGTAGANVIDGGGGPDVLIGYGGDDSYYVDQAGESIIESAGGGTDTIYIRLPVGQSLGQFFLPAFVENVTMLDGTGFVNLNGNELDNRLIGHADTANMSGLGGNDYLDSKLGRTSMRGGEGADTFAFTTALGGTNVDSIGDFQPGVDKIALDNAIFTGLPDGALSSTAFVAGSAAQDADDRIILNNGQLLFDVDGTGATAAVLFATVGSSLAITAGDFVVI